MSLFITKQQIRVFFYYKTAEQCSPITFFSITKQRKSVCCHFFHQKEAKKATRSLLFYITRRRIVSFYPEFKEPCCYYNKSAKSCILLSFLSQNSQIVSLFITRQQIRVFFFDKTAEQCSSITFLLLESRTVFFFITKQNDCDHFITKQRKSVCCHFFHQKEAKKATGSFLFPITKQRNSFFLSRIRKTVWSP